MSKETRIGQCWCVQRQPLKTLVYTFINYVHINDVQHYMNFHKWCAQQVVTVERILKLQDKMYWGFQWVWFELQLIDLLLLVVFQEAGIFPRVIISRQGRILETTARSPSFFSVESYLSPSSWLPSPQEMLIPHVQQLHFTEFCLNILKTFFFL